MDTEAVEAGDLEEGGLVVVDGDPCLIRSVETSGSGGKHGTEKVTVEAAALADGAQRTLTQPGDGDVPVPVFEATTNPLVLVGGEPHVDPLGVRIAPGGNVVWLWDDDEPHELVAEEGAFASDREDGEGYTFEHSFETPGVHPYACEEHDGLGVVVVEADE